MRPKWEDAGNEKPLDSGGSGRDTYEPRQLTKKSGNKIQSKSGGSELLYNSEKLTGGPKDVEY